jgi:putative endopeptidase
MLPSSCRSFIVLAALPCLAAVFSIGPVRAEDAGEWGTFGIQTQWIDGAADPGDDFDRHVNGKWNDSVEMPEDKSSIGAFIALRDLSEDRLKLVLEELADGKFEAGSSEARIATAYRAFMNTGAIEASGLAPARPWIDRIYAVKSVEELISLFAYPGYVSPIGAYVDADEKQSDTYALYIVQSGLGLPDRDYYLKDTEDNLEFRAKYVELLALLLDEIGYEDPQAAAKAVFALETRMAREMWDRAESRNRDLTYNKLSRDQVDALGPDQLLSRFVEGLGAGEASDVIVAQMPPSDEELVEAKLSPEEAAAKLGGGVPATLQLIEQVPLATWQAWVAAHFLSDHAAFLPSRIDDANFAFYGTALGGQPKQRQRWKRAISAVEGQIGELLGQIYARRYYPPEQKAAMEELVANLRKAMAANLKDLEWMGPDTRAEAVKKLNAFTPKIGEPEKYKAYEGLSVSEDAALGNQLASATWDADFMISRLGKQVDRSEWFMFPQTVNAYYNPVLNEIVFPAAILQPPFFNLSADPAVNYGAIGAVIGHEMGHGFDDQGAKSDGTGNLRDWWTEADKANFEKLQDRLVAQYNGFCPFDEGKTCVNGELTLGENIGDLGGLSLAYRAYRLSLGGKEAPVIGEASGDQRFFMAWAQVWRAKAREELARQYLVTDPHSPPKYRINGVVRNFDEWYRAFEVTEEAALYLSEEKRVRIW